jgi:hypothetical protein
VDALQATHGGARTTSGIGPLATEDYIPLAGLRSACKGGLAAPLEGSLACAAAPAVGGLGCAGGSPAACIMNSGQKLSSPNQKKGDIKEMVGSGDECEPDGWVIAARCPSCGHSLKLVKHGCGLISCPACARKWARRAAERAGARLFGAFNAKVSRWKPRHITFEIETLDWDAAKKKAASLGCTGGILVLHPWRLKAEFKQMFEIMAERTGRNRYDLAKESAFGMDAFEWSPHVHALAFGKFADVRKGSKIFEYRNIRRLNSQHAAEGSLLYLFGHTFIPPTKNGKCYRYFGICSPQKLKPSWTGTCHDWLRCPCCETPMQYEGGIDCIQVVRYIALGWHQITGLHAKLKGAPPPRAPRVAGCC